MSQQLDPRNHVDAVSDVVQAGASSVNHKDFTIPQGATVHSISADIEASTIGGVSSSHASRVDYSFLNRDAKVLKSGYGFVTNYEKSSSDARQSRNSLFDMLELKFPYGIGDITLRVMVENFDNSKGVNIRVFAPYTAVRY